MGQVVQKATEVAALPERMQEARLSLAKSKGLAFETRRWPYILMLPVMWILTFSVIIKKTVYRSDQVHGINTFLFDGLGSSCRAIKEGATTSKALEIIYNYSPGQKKGIGGFVDDFWVGMINAQAVRNRLKLVKQELRKAISEFSLCEEVRLLSLACGSAQGVIEVVDELKAEGIKVKALLVDSDQGALERARKLAIQHGVGGQIKMIRNDVFRAIGVSRKFQPHVVEMLGLLDYLPDETAVKFIGKIRESMEDRGAFLTCNISHNPEMHFLKWVINWEMRYRTPRELREITARAGFQKIRLMNEPLKIHHVVVAHK